MNPISNSNRSLKWLWLSLAFIVVDQLTKLAVVVWMPLYSRIEISSFFNLVHVRNEGAAFSFLSDAGGWQRWFFTGLALFISGLLIYWLRKTPQEHKLTAIAYAMIIGGAIGNAIDRVIYGNVVDFLDFYWNSSHWPAFNVADSVIMLGAALLILDGFRTGSESTTSNKESS
ncbi:lipoprotein signal peptidase [Alginatibacterium sediminis]|uniref:Lipoprotein signal peptidase n=1 Tax=Alginatibacterium sediminis TaxID=2164068 RepID=A0A420EJT8_9ALTE|nr:signal peptidase II [Alginatibacterium sediminis]RKF20920.1 lipoprotein signal peptidase [Alginatibacterium sediminis]